MVPLRSFRQVGRLALAAASFSAVASAQVWVGETGDWFNASLWSLPAAVPTASTDPSIDNGTARISGGSATARGVYVGYNPGSSGTLALDSGGSLVSSSAILGYNEGASGTVTLDQGSYWSAGSSVTVGLAGHGTLGLSNGSYVGAGLLTIGSGSLSQSTVTIASGGQLMVSGTAVIGSSGTGTVTATGGLFNTDFGVLGYHGSGVGNVTIAGATWSNYGLNVGLFGSGTLTVENGGTVNSSGESGLGTQAGSNGRATISGANSRWAINGGLILGVSGDAALSVADGGQVTSTSALVGINSSAIGSANLAGAGSRWNIGGQLTLGQAGEGSLEIADSAKVAANTAVLGNNASGRGAADLHSGGELEVTQLTIGDSGEGEMTVQSGGWLLTHSNVTLGASAGGDGVLMVTGTGSRWNGGAVIVGAAGNGAISVADQAQVQTGALELGSGWNTQGTVTVERGARWNAGDVVVGRNGTGTLTVDNADFQGGNVSVGADSAVQVQADSSFIVGALTVADKGTATVSISGGSSVRTYRAAVGVGADSDGTVTVGNASDWVNSTSFTIGAGGAGAVTVAGGSSVVSETTVIGGTSQGSLNVIGTDSTWASSNGLTVGAEAVGVLKVSDGARVQVGGRLVLGATNGATGQLIIGDGDAPGTITAAVIENVAGTGVVMFNHNASDYGFVTSMAGGLGVTAAGPGTTTLLVGNTYSGHTIVTGGTLAAGAANVLSESSALFVNNGATVSIGTYDQTVGDFDSYNFSTGEFDTGIALLDGGTLTSRTRVTNNWAGSLRGTGHFVKEGTAAANWSGANTFTGTLTVDAGTLRANAADTLSPNAVVTVAAGATLDLNHHAQTTAGLAGAGAVALGGATLTLNQDENTTFAGVISSAATGALVKNGYGVLTLSGANTYAGGTTLTSGILRAEHANAFGTGGVVVTGGQLQLDDQAIANAVDLRGGGVSGLTHYAGTMTVRADIGFGGAVGGTVIIAEGGLIDTSNAAFTGSLTIADGGALTGSGTVHDLVAQAGGTLAPGGSLTVTGDLTLGVGSLTLIELSGDLARGIDYDAIAIGGAFNVQEGAQLSVVLLDGFKPGANATFQLFTASSFGGSFAATDLVLPTLGGGLVWDTSALTTTGVLSVAGSPVPEPGTWAAVAGVAALGLAVWRRHGRARTV